MLARRAAEHVYYFHSALQFLPGIHSQAKSYYFRIGLEDKLSAGCSVVVAVFFKDKVPFILLGLMLNQTELCEVRRDDASQYSFEFVEPEDMDKVLGNISFCLLWVGFMPLLALPGCQMRYVQLELESD